MTAVALAALGLLFYTYLGYPLVLMAWARLAPRRVLTNASFEPTVSVCLAVHDGERFLKAKVKSLQALAYPREKVEILVCSDGSTDETEALSRELARLDSRIRVFALEKRVGKPTAVNLLRREARGEVLFMTDVRQTLAPLALRALVAPLADPSVGCVSGALVLAGNTGASAYWRYERFIRSREAMRGALVGVSGSIYVVRRAELAELPSDVLLDDMFVPLSLVRSRKCVLLSEEAEAYDEATEDDREFSRKVRTLAGNYQLFAKMPWLLSPGANNVWFELVSHKLLRLVCPWALFVLLFASGWLAFDGSLYPAVELGWRAIWLGQLFFYGLALVGRRAGRFGVIARTFVIMNVAALVGLWRFLRGSQAVTW